MLQTFRKFADAYLGTGFNIYPAPASLCKDGYNSLIVCGSFSKNSWTVKLGLDPAFNATMMTPAICSLGFHKDLVKGSKGQTVFTNDEIINFVSTTCNQLSDWSPEARQSKIAAFAKLAYDCGCKIEPTFPTAVAASAPNAKKNLG